MSRGKDFQVMKNLVSIKKLNVLWTLLSKSLDDKKLLKLILIKLELNLKIMKTWEVLTVKNQVQIVEMLELELQTFWIMCSVKRKKAYLSRKISFTLPEVISDINSLKLGLWKLTRIFRNFFSMTNEYNSENEI